MHQPCGMVICHISRVLTYTLSCQTDRMINSLKPAIMVVKTRYIEVHWANVKCQEGSHLCLNSSMVKTDHNSPSFNMHLMAIENQSDLFSYVFILLLSCVYCAQDKAHNSLYMTCNIWCITSTTIKIVSRFVKTSETAPHKYLKQHILEFDGWNTGKHWRRGLLTAFSF